MHFPIFEQTKQVTMKKKLLFIGLCVCSLANFSYGQSQTNSLKESAPIVVSSHPELSAQRAKLDSKQAEINQAVTSSRAQAAKLNDEFRVLKEEYVRLLKVEWEKTTDGQLKTQLQEEMARYSEAANPQTR
jgi:predicted nuclease with TOPRIM domain